MQVDSLQSEPPGKVLESNFVVSAYDGLFWKFLMHSLLRALRIPAFYPETFFLNIQFSSVQSLSHMQFFAAPWSAACQASLSITNSWSLLKLKSIESVMPSNHLILCHPLLLPPSIFPSIRVFSDESVLHIKWPKYWSFSFNIKNAQITAQLHSSHTLLK